MNKTAGTMIREFEEERTMTDHELVLQVREMFEEKKKENTKLRELLRMQTLMQERIRTGVIGLVKKVDGTIYPCEYNDALSDVVRLIDTSEKEPQESEVTKDEK